MAKYLRRLRLPELFKRWKGAPYERVGQASFWNDLADRPIFSLWTAEKMVVDDTVGLALAVRDSFLSQAQVKIEGGPSHIRKFVEDQLRSIWSQYSSLLAETKRYGYMAFEMQYKMERSGPWAGKAVFHKMRSFHPRDSKPLVYKDEVVGIRISSTAYQDFQIPKSLWVTFNAPHGSHYGLSCLRSSYAPWYEKTMRNGGNDLRRLRMVKDAWIGDKLYYPAREIFYDINGEPISARDVAREIVEGRVSGGVAVIPSEYDPVAGKRTWEYEAASDVRGATQIFEYIDHLDDKIMRGVHVAPEVIQAAETGSGFSGRLVPLMVTLSMTSNEHGQIIRCLKPQVLDELVRINFHTEPQYTIEPIPLVKTFKMEIGSSEGGDQNMMPQKQPMTARPEQNGRPQPQPQSNGFKPRIAQMSAVSMLQAPEHGFAVGGVYYPEGTWLHPSELEYASEEERKILHSLGVLDVPSEEAELVPTRQRVSSLFPN